MEKQRILEIEDGYGMIRYYPQVRKFGIWFYIKHIHNKERGYEYIGTTLSIKKAQHGGGGIYSEVIGIENAQLILEKRKNSKIDIILRKNKIIEDRRKEKIHKINKIIKL